MMCWGSDCLLYALQCNEEECEVRKIYHYHFTSWPDHGVPEYAGPILTYLKKVKAKQHQKQEERPILIHCR